MKKTITRIAFLAITLGSLSSYAQEQKPEEKEKDLYDLSLEELMNIPIRSASKKDETLFEAPLSSYTITRADMDRAGSTTIMEALRMAPGVIVREQANGVYDIHIRGFDNILRTAGDFGKSNLITLVMIDNRPVFNNNIGGTFWESLPVGIHDVERIEIVRGPSAPLFGPNAVSGVINIITRKVEGLSHATASVQGGTTGTLIASASVGKSFGKWSTLVSANHQQRDRFDSDYYQSSTGQFVPGNDLNPNFNTQYPHSSRATNSFGVNGFVGYRANEKTTFDLSVGTQAAELQKVFLGGFNTKFSTNKSNSSYANLAAKISNLSIRTSFVTGSDNLNVGDRPNEYDYQVISADAEYAVKVNEKISVTPGISYQHVKYDDTDYRVEGNNTNAGLLNGTPTINTTAGFIRTDFNFTSKWRLLAAIRGDKFSSPDKTYLAYELASTYKLNENNLIRVAFTRSNSGSFIGYNYLNIIVPTPLPGLSVTQSGNTDLKLFTISMIELGYRAQLTDNLQLDIDLFNQRAEHFTAVTAEVYNPMINTITGYRFNNLPTTATQNGATLSFNFVPGNKIQFKPFVTVQKTETKDLPSSYAEASVDPTLTYSTRTHKSTPSVYGGYYLNYKPGKKFNFNLNGYYFSSHRQYDASDANETSATGNIKAKFLVNLKATWHATSQIDVFVNGRNVLNTDSREFFGTDRIGGLYLAGASFSLN